jgi:hypothetical protein
MTSLFRSISRNNEKNSISRPILNVQPKTWIKSKNFSTEKYSCNRFFPHKEYDISPTEADEAIIIINSPIPSHFKRFWKKGKESDSIKSDKHSRHSFIKGDCIADLKDPSHNLQYNLQ